MRKWFGLHIGDWSQTYARTRVFVDKQGRQPCPAQLVKAGRIKPFGPFVTRPDSMPYPYLEPLHFLLMHPQNL